MVALSLLAVLSLAVYTGVWGLARGAEPVPFQSAQLEGVPLQINHQGFIREGGAVFNGIGEFRFALVDPDSGNNLWTNDRSHLGDPGMPDTAVPILVDRGNYSVRLGNTDLLNMTQIPTTVFEDDNVELRIC